jgi:hypothetical protein
LTIESASTVISLYGFCTDAVRWQIVTGSCPEPSVVGGLAGVCPTVVVGAGAVVPVVVEELAGGAVDVDEGAEDTVVVEVGGGDAGGEVVGLVVVCAPTGDPKSSRAKKAPLPTPRTMARRTRAPYPESHETCSTAHTA